MNRGTPLAGQIALVGGDEFRPGCEPVDRAILAASGMERPAVLVLPTAAAFESPEKAARNGVQHFTKLGAEASPLMALNSSDANDASLLSAIDRAGVIYLTGGSPAHLLEVLSGSLLLTKLREALDRGAVVAGSSAGAMVMGEWMRFRGRWSQALGIVPGVAVLPHHERADPDATATELTRDAPPGLKVFGIDATSCCLGSGGDWQALGGGRVVLYQNGAWRAFTQGQRITLE